MLDRKENNRYLRVMRKEDTIQDFRRFSEQLAYIVIDYIKYSSGIDETDGVYIDEEDNIELVNRADVQDSKDFYPISSLIQEDGGELQPSYDVIDEITSKYIFVR